MTRIADLYSARIHQALASMLDFKVTALGLAAMAIGLQAIRWLAGRKRTTEDKSTPASSAESSPSKLQPEESQEKQANGRPSWAENSVPESPSRSLADHPLFGPSLFGRDSLHGETGEPEQVLDEKTEEAPRKKTRVKRLRFEQPDVNGKYHSDQIESASLANQDQERSLSQQGSPDSNNSQNLQKSPYADVAVEWSLPPFSVDKSLPAIPEDGEMRRGNHRRNTSVVTESGDTTPFSTREIELASAPTQNGTAISDAQVGSALAEVGQQLPPRRHSRSFSEPNLAGMSAMNCDPELQSALRTSMDSEENGGDASPDYYEAERAREPGSAEAGENREPSGNDEPSSFPKHNGQKVERNGRSTGAPPLLRLEIITGPVRGQIFTMDDRDPRIKIGRMPDNHVHVEDLEVSSYHAEVYWSNSRNSWLVRDMGSMNGTRLNGNFISNAARKPGRMWKLSSDDILLLGHRTSVKVAHLPNADLRTVHSNLSVYTPPSGLEPCVTMKSEAIASLRAELGTQKALREPTLRLEAGMTCHIGAEHLRRSQSCEDVPFMGEPGRSGAALYCIFDGHCGHQSSRQCASLLPETLRKRMKAMKPSLDSGEGLDKLWEEVFLSTDRSLETEDGTTATAVLVWKDEDNNICIQAANVGDSAAVLWRTGQNSISDPNGEQLTTDHRIVAPAERKRLADSGIELQEGADRLYGLNVSRCLGDHYLKDLGLIAVPSVSSVVKISPQESALLILASDGLWDVAKPADVLKCTRNSQEQTSDITEVAEAVFQLAMDRRSRDDVTIIVLDIQPEIRF